MTWEIVVIGKVQGVYYRLSTKKKADELGIKGWVRNHQDGTVRIIAQGEELIFKSFLEWLHQGPERAIVQIVEWKEIDQEEDFTDFEIIRD